MEDPLLDVIHVAKQYDPVGGPAGPMVLRDIELRLAEGQSVAIVGPSGCGKSTLLNIIGTLDKPTAGHVFFQGRDLGGLGDAELSLLRSRSIGFVFQFHHLLPQCTVMENVLVPVLARGARAGDDLQARARDLLQRVGLFDRLDHRPGQLSGGECQRVAVVRAMINAPQLLLADEPTGSLDRAAAGDLADLLAELQRERGMAMIVVTHSTDLAGRMGAVLELRDGMLTKRPAAEGSA